MNRGPIDRTRSSWFAALVAFLVALGAQELLGAIVPVDFSAATSRLTSDALWISWTVIRLLSFAMGGVVAVLLLGALTGRLLGMLFVVAVLATVFEQFPGRPNWDFAVLWSCAGPLGVFAGAWVASARRGAA